MTSLAIRFSLRVYDSLLGCYPPGYRLRFRGEMNQVFAQLVSAQCHEKGALGLLQLWIPILADWAWAVSRQWIINHKEERQGLMSAALERQLSDLTWSVMTGLRAAFDLRQVFEAIAKEAPEPAASCAKVFLVETEQGADIQSALLSMQQAYPTPYLQRLIAAILAARQAGRNIPDALEPLTLEYLHECGSDPAFYAFMRREAGQLGAPVPERAISLA